MSGQKETTLRFPLPSLQLSIEHGNFIEAEADALICPIDKDLSIRLGAAEAVREAEGPGLAGQLQAATKGFQVGPGNSFKIDCQRLKARHVYFAVVCDVYWDAFKAGMVESCMRSAFTLAQRGGLVTLAMPPLGHPSLAPKNSFLATEMLGFLFRYGAQTRFSDTVRGARLVIDSQEAFNIFAQEALHIYDKLKPELGAANDAPAPSEVPWAMLPNASSITGPSAERQKEPEPEQPQFTASCIIAAITPEERAFMRLGEGFRQDDTQLVVIPSLSKAIELFKTTKPDVILLDHTALGLGDSLKDTLRDLRDRTDPYIGTILWAENYLFEAMLEALANEVDAFLPKTANLSSFRHAVFTATEKRNLRASRAKLIEDLAQMNEMQEKFLHMVSHDIKNPLTVFKGGVDLLAMRVESAGAMEATASVFKMLKSSLDNMQNLINDLTDFASMQTGKLKIQQIELDVSALVNEAADAFEIIARGKGIVFGREIAAGLPKAKLDPRRIHQVLMNFLGNSLKHTPRGQSIKLRVGVEGPNLKFEVADTGEGIDPAELPKIFEPFYQSKDSEVNKREGLGLGLTICRAIIAQHSGSLAAHSDGVGKGMTIRVMIPFAPAEPGDAIKIDLKAAS